MNGRYAMSGPYATRRRRTKTSAAAVTAAVTAVAVMTGALTLAAEAPAHATDYRYWSLRHGDDGTWRPTAEGPGTYRPEDGAVEGWRFAVFKPDSKDSVVPRAEPDFDAICASTPEKKGTKRVALVLDFGTEQHAPSGEKPPSVRTHCVRLPPEATTAEALAKAAPPLRYDSSGLLCAIAGYPRRGCGEVVADGAATGESDAGRDGDHNSGQSDGTSDSGASDSGASDSGTDGASDGGPSVGLLLGGAAVAALAGAAVWQSRRRRGPRF